MNFLRLFLTLLSFFILTNLSAQNRKCSATEHTKTLMSQPEYQQNFRERMVAFNQVAATKTTTSRLNCTDITTIPIAVHFQDISANDRPCLEDLVNQQIATLNADFQGSNVDISNWTNSAASLFPGISNGETCVEFCVATRSHPAGYNLAEGQMAITINQTTGDRVSNWAGYLNIFVTDIGDNILGYSPLGGQGNGDGVVIAKFAFGGTNACGDISTSSSLDRGRTLTHEVGHFFLLDHIWGGGCNQDDSVDDTPSAAEPNYGCPQNGIQSCNTTDMHMNYMDYSNDECMYMFSAGQSTRMENYLAANLQSFINNGVNTCGPPAEPTCEDGIQNGGETGVDCGGETCPTCPEPTCEDGIQNGNETGIDCGGSCTPCVSEPTCSDGIQNGNETGIDCGAPDCAECPVDCAQNLVSVLIRPDNYGSEVTWVIQDEAGNEMASGGPYVDFNTNIVQTDVCLPVGCYNFTIFDAFSDGICCEFGNGEYAILDLNGNILTSSDGNYAASETNAFAAGGTDCETTPPTPPADRCIAPEPTNLEYFNDLTRVRINWDIIPDANRYQIQYKEEGFPDWTRVSTSRTRKTLRNLFPSTYYEVRFRSRCPEGWTEYSPIYGFATLSGRLTTEEEATVLDYQPIEFNRMYPNPTSNQLNIDYILDTDNKVNINIYDMLGRKVINQSQQQEEGQQKISLNVANLQNGAYILQINTENQQIIRKFIKN